MLLLLCMYIGADELINITLYTTLQRMLEHYDAVTSQLGGAHSVVA